MWFSEGLEVGIHEQDVSALNIHESGRGVLDSGIGRADLLNLKETLIEERRSEKHTVLLTIIGNQLEDTTSRHECE
jgi:hypothetical protein